MYALNKCHHLTIMNGVSLSYAIPNSITHSHTCFQRPSNRFQYLQVPVQHELGIDVETILTIDVDVITMIHSMHI